MNCDRKFKQQILLKCIEEFENAGFSRFRKHNVDYPIDRGFNCWVGLAFGVFPDRVELYPNVGVHVVPIEKFVCELDQGPYAGKYDRSLATYATNLGLLESCSDQRAFAFAPEQSSSFVSSECKRLAQLYLVEGLEYAKSIACYEELVPLLKECALHLGGNPERYSACLYLSGKGIEARGFLENFPDRYKEYIEGFSVPFLEKLKNEI